MSHLNYDFMDWTQIILGIVAAASSGGWLTTTRLRRQDAAKAAQELADARHALNRADEAHTMQMATTLVEKYNEMVITPLNERVTKLENQNEKYGRAVLASRTCTLYPNCPVLNVMYNAQDNDSN